MLSGIADRICCTPCSFGQITNAHAAVIHKMSVAPVHTSVCIFPSCIDYLVSAALDAFIDRSIPLAPSFCLSRIWQHQYQEDKRIPLFQRQHSLCRHCIKAQCSSRAKKAVSLINQTDNDVKQSPIDDPILPIRNSSMPGKARSSLFHLPLSSHSALIICRIVDFSQQYALNFFAFCGYNLTRGIEVRG